MRVQCCFLARAAFVCVCFFVVIHSFIHSLDATEAYYAVYLFTKATCLSAITHSQMNVLISFNVCAHLIHIHRHSVHAILFHRMICECFRCYCCFYLFLPCVHACVCVYKFSMVCCSLSGWLKMDLCVCELLSLYQSLVSVSL